MQKTKDTWKIGNSLFLINKFLDFLFPKKCLGCRKADTYCCEECLKGIRPLGRHFSSENETQMLGSLEGFFAFTKHQEDSCSAKLIHALKYDGVRELAPLLASLLHEIIQKHPEKFQNAVLVPVPLHWRRKNARGFNQSELLAECTARNTGLVCRNLLFRKRFTRPQVELNRTQRLKNLIGAFQSKPSIFFDPQISYFLVDDVCTTGATLNECAAALQKAGAKKVYGLVVAK